MLAEPTGAIELVTAAELRPHLEACHDARAARTPGAVTRTARAWDRFAGLTPRPGDTSDPGLRRAAIWRDADGVVSGAVTYTVSEQWTDNRPRGKAEVGLLVGGTPEAERELWRHLIDVDWVAHIEAGPRPVDDPLPLLLADARGATSQQRSDHIWSRILDVPATFSAYRPDHEGAAVIEVVDPGGFAAGRWRLEVGPDGSQVTSTAEGADVTLPVTTLGAVHLGGTSVTRLHHAGWLDEERVGGVARLANALATPTAPWSPTSY
jgi:predicted acetyltransferase